MNAQEIFDKSAAHLLQQMRRAMDPKTVICSYRGEAGRTCAIGCLIPDHLYTPDIERTAVSDIDAPCYIEPERKERYIEPERKERCIKLKSILEDAGLWEHRSLLEALQQVHDSYEPDNWLLHLHRAANEFNLNKQVLT